MLIPSGRAAAQGHTLLELLVAMVISVILLVWMADSMSRTMADHGKTLQRNRLNQAFQTTLAMMERELRRAGYWGNGTVSAKNGPVNPFFLSPHGLKAGNMTGQAGQSCLTYSYDLNKNGLLDQTTPDERFGFRLNQGMVEMRTGGDTPLACDTGSWTGLTSTAVVVDQLYFNLANAYCINLSKAGANCLIVTPAKGDLLRREYRVDLTMSGHLKQMPTIQRTDTLSIRVRNERVESAP